MRSLKVTLVVEVDAAGARVTESRVEEQEASEGGLVGDDVAARTLHDALFSVVEVGARVEAAIVAYEQEQRVFWEANDAAHELEKQTLRDDIAHLKALLRKR